MYTYIYIIHIVFIVVLLLFLLCYKGLRSRKESDLFGWSWSWIPKNTEN